jgi:hypothetical protein
MLKNMTNSEARRLGKEILRHGWGVQLREDLKTGETYLSTTNRAGRDRAIFNQQDWDDLRQFEVAR